MSSLSAKISDTIASLRRSGLSPTVDKIIQKTIGARLTTINDRAAFFEKHGMIHALDLTPEQWKANVAITQKEEFLQADVKTINWFIPRFDHVLYGGIYTIFRFAEYFQKYGIHNRIVIYDNPHTNLNDLRTMVSTSFPALQEAEYLVLSGDVNTLPESDASICTFWTSAYIMARFTKTKKKFYFIQDFEPLFYSANSYYALAETSYRLGYQGIVNTPGLAEIISREYGMNVRSFTPAVNTELYNISEEELMKKHQSEPIQITVYARPHHDRNAFELALATLKQLKEKYGDRIRIIAAGDEWHPKEYGVEGVIENVGRLSSLTAVADLYRNSHIGLVFMFTKHPSYQPFEYMASGTVVATNVNNANTWLLKDNENALVMEPIPSIMVDRISTLIESPELRLRIAQAGMETVMSHEWDEQCESIYRFIQSPTQ